MKKNRKTMKLTPKQVMEFEERIFELETRGNILKAVFDLVDQPNLMVGVNPSALDMALSDSIDFLLQEVMECSRFYSYLMDSYLAMAQDTHISDK